jgi:hypothetical protein
MPPRSFIIAPICLFSWNRGAKIDIAGGLIIEGILDKIQAAPFEPDDSPPRTKNALGLALGPFNRRPLPASCDHKRFIEWLRFEPKKKPAESLSLSRITCIRYYVL